LVDLQGVEPRITQEAFEVLGMTRSLRSRTSYSGAAPVNVRKQANAWLKKLAKRKG